MTMKVTICILQLLLAGQPLYYQKWWKHDIEENYLRITTHNCPFSEQTKKLYQWW